MALEPLRLVRAFAWMRWRLVVNTIKGTRRRDTLERFSRVGSVLIPLVLAVTLIPVLLAFSVLSFAGGMTLASGGPTARLVLVVLRIFLTAMMVAVILAPALRSVRGAGTSLSRFVLLPIPRGLLYVADVSSSLADPWIALTVPIFLLLPIGLAVKGAYLAAGLALIAGAVMFAILLVLGSAISHALSLLYRDRKRGEIVTLIVLVAMSFAGIVPIMLPRQGEALEERIRSRSPTRSPAAADQKSAGRSDRAGDDAERDDGSALPSERSGGGSAMPGGSRAEDGEAAAVGRRPADPSGSDGAVDGEIRGEEQPARSGGPNARISAPAGPGADVASPIEADRAGSGSPSSTEQSRRGSGSGRGVGLRIPPWLKVVPPELYARVVTLGVEGRIAASLASLGGLVLFGAVLTGLSWKAYGRLLSSPEGGSSRRAAMPSRRLVVRLPGLGPASSAVALALIRVVLRTVQGKMAVYFTPVSLLVFMFVMTKVRGGGFGLSSLGEYAGPGVAVGGMIFMLLALQKMMLNQFAIDGAGLTLQLLAPVTDRQIVIGKAAGMGILFAGPSLFFLMAVVVFLPAGSPWLWMAAVLCGAAAFLLFAPVAATLSALFPKPANLSRIGAAGNPNSFASFVGFFATLLAFSPPLILALLSILTLGSPAIALASTAAWTAISALLFAFLTRLAAHVVESRRENLALVAQNR